ncbi:hypothetical protein LEMLEM_LOCUS9011 [Lemmus lemmus]
MRKQTQGSSACEGTQVEKPSIGCPQITQHISSLLSHHQRSFLLQQMGTKRETGNWTMCRE